MRLGRWLFISAFLLLAPWCTADEAEPADFSQGFKQLAGLGLPPLPAGTKWSVLPESLTENRSESPKGMNGNGWLLSPPESGKRKAVLMGDVSVTEIETETEHPAPTGGLLGRMLGSGGKKESSTAEADLAKDVKTLRAELEKQGEKRNDNDYESFGDSQEGMASGRLLVFATQIYQTGDAKLANELASTLFQSFHEREAVVDAAINQLASQQYEAATTSFFEARDWKVYHREMVSLVTKFPRGWKDQGAAALLLNPLSKRAAGNPPATPKLDGIEIDSRAIESVKWMIEDSPASKSEKVIPPEIAAQLSDVPARFRAQYLRQMSMDDGSSLGQPGTWLLKKPEELNKDSGIAGPTLQLGIAALPALAALMDDSFLTNHVNPGNNDDSYYSSDESPSERVLKAYARMNRPATRGDLAKYLLEATMPDPDNEISNADAQSLRDLTIEFWKNHQNDTQEGLALAFLQEGSSEQKTEAARLLAASANPADQKALESHILGDASPVRQIVAVKAYILVKKSAAKPFLDLYVKALREELGDGAKLESINDLPWDIRELGSIEPLIKQLESQVSGKSPQARAREIAKEDPKTARSAIPAFLESLSDAPPRRKLLAMLAGAVAAEDPEIRGLFINATFRANYSDREDQEEDAEPKTERTIPPGESKAWKTLLSDERDIPAAITRGTSGYGTKMGEFAAIAMEYAVDPNAFEKVRMATAVTGKTSAQIQVPRANARLAGEPIPPLPDASKVSPARLAEIVAAAGAKPPLEIHPYLKNLPDDERAAWLKWYQEPGEIPIPENVRKLAMIVTQRWAEAGGFYKDMPGTMDIEIGFEVSKDTLEKYFQHLAGNINGYSRSMLMLGSASFPPGLQVLTLKMDLPEKKPEPPQDGDESSENEETLGRVITPRQVFSNCINDFQSPELPPAAVAVIYGSSSAGHRSRSTSSWWIIDGKPVLKKPENGQTEFMTSLAERTDDDGEFHLQIQVLSRADADALKESE